MAVIVIKVAASIVLGVLAGFAAIYIFNKMPAEWLCDYGEKPSAELTDPHIRRVKGYPWRWVYAAGFSCLLVRLSFYDVRFAAAALFACWALLIIGLADLKYMIIPDQFVIMLALTAFGFIPFYGSILQPAAGAVIGGGAIFIVGLLAKAVYKKEAMGFGDVKLFASLGLVLGVTGIIFVLVASSLHSGVSAAAGMVMKKHKKDDEMPFGPYICGWGAFYIFVIAPFMLQ